jgi:hypothetical protein
VIQDDTAALLGSLSKCRLPWAVAFALSLPLPLPSIANECATTAAAPNRSCSPSCSCSIGGGISRAAAGPSQDSPGCGEAGPVCPLVGGEYSTCFVCDRIGGLT